MRRVGAGGDDHNIVQRLRLTMQRTSEFFDRYHKEVQASAHGHVTKLLILTSSTYRSTNASSMACSSVIARPLAQAAANDPESS